MQLLSNTGFFASFPMHLGGQKPPISTVAAKCRILRRVGMGQFITTLWLLTKLRKHLISKLVWSSFFVIFLISLPSFPGFLTLY